MRPALLIALLLLTGCATQPPVGTPPWVGSHRNACLPEAAAMAQSLRKSEIQARVLAIYTPEWGHAITVYMYPPGANQMWGWDSYWKSLRLRAWIDNPESIARNWISQTNPGTPLRRAEFLD